MHYCVKYGETMRIADNEYSEFQKFMKAVSAVERRFDFIVIVVRNRLSKIGSRNKQLVASGLKDLSLPLGFRAIDGFAGTPWCITSSSRAD